MVFQKSTDQFVALTVSDEIKISQRHSLAPHYWNDERIQTAIEALNLAHVTQQVSYQLSGGQQKKLQVLVMLIMAQPVLLFDEPLAGLDMTSLTVVLQLIKKPWLI
nr:ATP-binding cassette domain-containing protein [Leuconostoc fallax]